MNIKDKMILDGFRRERSNFLKLEEIVYVMLKDAVKSSGIKVDRIEHRVKGEESLEGKLYKNGDYYQKLEDLTDLLGARIICYFGDDVDKIGMLIEEMFVIDRENSSDKRALMKVDSFGYLSLHYICSLPEDRGYPKEVLGKRFEIQIRTILQHAWAAIVHDLGYKTEFGVPRGATRAFARLAGLLEIADDEFIRTRDIVEDYTESIREKIINDNADDVGIDLVSLREYMSRNKKMRAFLEKLCAIEGSELTEAQPDAYILQLKWLGIDTVGKLQELFDKNEELAFLLAEKTLRGSELDILASNVALRYICRAELLRRDLSEEQIADFISLSSTDRARAENQAKRLIKFYGELK